MKSKYTEKVKQQLVEMAKTTPLIDLERKYKVPAKTISRWASQSGVTTVYSKFKHDDPELIAQVLELDRTDHNMLQIAKKIGCSTDIVSRILFENPQEFPAVAIRQALRLYRTTRDAKLVEEKFGIPAMQLMKFYLKANKVEKNA